MLFNHKSKTLIRLSRYPAGIQYNFESGAQNNIIIIIDILCNIRCMGPRSLVQNVLIRFSSIHTELVTVGN